MDVRGERVLQRGSLNPNTAAEKDTYLLRSKKISTDSEEYML
jgi:hypothetical protein